MHVGIGSHATNSQYLDVPSSSSGLTPKQAEAKPAEAKPAKCKAAQILKHADYWGEALVYGGSNKVDSVEECCNQCSSYSPKSADAPDCNVWVYCESPTLCKDQYRECWLKHLAHPDAASPSNEGPEVGWTTGLMTKSSDGSVDGDGTTEPPEERKYHIVISAQGSATHWQSRVHYYWYKKIKKQCETELGSECQMGGFTRILHSGEPDDLMDEIPTFVAQTLPQGVVNDGYVVLNRPWAFVQWIEKAKIPEKYVLMSEPDHVWLKPMPNLMVGKNAAAFPFFYIEPSKAEYLPIVQRFVGPINRTESEKIAPMGNAPTMMSVEDLRKVIPTWYNLSIAIHKDEEAVKAWGWVQEMYAFTLAAYKSGLRNVGLHAKMMSQPPWDTKLEPYYILHYTYGMDYTLDGKFTPGKYGEWRFDKRTYSVKPPPRGLGEPPEGMPNELVRHLIHAINEASEAIPGWDEYEKTGHASQLWDGKLE